MEPMLNIRPENSTRKECLVNFRMQTAVVEISQSAGGCEFKS